MSKEFSKSYTNSRWKKFRKDILQRDNFRCCRCGKSFTETELHVHHLNYYPGKKPWEYPNVELITLCKGCHAQEHGIIMPQSGWKYCGEVDLEDLSGECEACGNQIRYEHHIFHPNWGYLTVGCQCADRLTGVSDASEVERQRRDKASKFKTFRNSPKWKLIGKTHQIKYKGFDITIKDYSTYFLIDIEFRYINSYNDEKYEKLKSNKEYNTLEEAKYAAFDAIISGSLKSYINRHYGKFFCSDFKL